MRRSQAFRSNYLGKDDLNGHAVTAAILKVTMEKVKDTDSGEDRDKPVMYFQEDVKPLILNNINWITCEDAYGEDSDSWSGRLVELFVDPNVMFGAKRVGGVRLRIPQRTIPPVVLHPMRWSEALALCEQNGISEADLKVHLRSLGNNSFSSARDSQAVRDFVASHRPAPVTPGGFAEEDIPF